MLTLIDLTFYCNEDHDEPWQLIGRQYAALGYAAQLRNRMQVQVIKHMNQPDMQLIHDEVPYYFFKGNNRFGHVPFHTLRHVSSQKPDIVLVQGLIFPLQVLLLKMRLGKNALIIVQHHGEKPFIRLKKILQGIADRFINAYIFTANGNAEEWLQKKMISRKEKCHEILEASTSFRKMNKNESRLRTGIEGNASFLWVGRLDRNKDPFTVLTAFDRYLAINHTAKLYMIFQEDQLLQEINGVIDASLLLKESVTLLGKISHEQLPYWYSAAGFYISASHKEGSGYALLEAMSCGCIPVVTAIPSYIKITAHGRHGFLFEPDDVDALYHIFTCLPYAYQDEISESIQEYFDNELSFRAIADKMHTLCNNLVAKQVHNGPYGVFH